MIEFDEHGRKTFATRLVVLQAPTSRRRQAPRKRAVKKKKAAQWMSQVARQLDVATFHPPFMFVAL